jgi:hypothetical protein
LTAGAFDGHEPKPIPRGLNERLLSGAESEGVADSSGSIPLIPRANERRRLPTLADDKEGQDCVSHLPTFKCHAASHLVKSRRVALIYSERGDNATGVMAI